MISFRLGPYEILSEIGRGGMATVYRAYQASVDRDVAVKVIQKAIASDEAMLERFRREARLIARLEHPHILPIYDFDGTHDPPYIVMRYVDSGTLKDVLTERPMSFSDILFLLQQIASALDYAHEQGIVHRDIKPSNIMLDRKGNVLVSDFGIARMVGSSSSTQSGATIGTPDYMPPEQVRGVLEVDGRADVYSLGVMSFAMLTGHLPFTAVSPVEVVLKHLQEAPPAPTQINPTLPAAIDAVIARALAKTPTERYPTAGAFVDAVRAALGASTASAPLLVGGLGYATQVGHIAAEMETDIQTTPSEENKTVTALYADAGEYATLVEEQVGTETAQRTLHRLWDKVAQLITLRDGDIVAQADNHLLAVWGATTTREDDAASAIHTALALQAALRAQGTKYFTETDDEPIPLNIGVHTGLALITNTENGRASVATGATLALAQKLADSADGALLISHDTLGEVQGVFTILPALAVKMRGRKEGMRTYRVMAVKARAFRVHTRGVEGLEIPMIGREAELKRLQGAYLNAYEENETQVVTLLGEAGIGKSRLMEEFSKWYYLRLEDIHIFHGRATPTMTEHPYALWHNVLSYRFEILNDDPMSTVRTKLEQGVAQELDIEVPEGAELPEADGEIAHMMGYLAGFELNDSPHIKHLLGDPQHLAARARQLVGQFFARLGAFGPIVIELEDLRHADDASLDLFNELVTTHLNLPLLMVCHARPSLLERRPTWGTRQAFHERLTLGPLTKRESRDLARALLQKIQDPPKALRDLLVERAEGNPLFMEELVKMLIDDRVILKDGDVWQVEESRLTHLRVPPSLIGILQARLDTLLYPEKLTLQRAAVYGRLFVDNVLMALDIPDDTHLTDLPMRLRTLEKRGFIERRDNTSFVGSNDYAFTQTLLHELIYATLLERQRHVYHAACARWLAATARAAEHWPLIAEHYEKSGAPLEAAQAFENAGDRAVQVSAFNDAIRFYQRGLPPAGQLEYAQEANERVVRLFSKLAETHYLLANFHAARTAADNALRLAGTPAARARALMVLNTMSPDEPSADARLGGVG